MTDTKAKTELTMRDVWNAATHYQPGSGPYIQRKPVFEERLAQYVAQQNRAYVKRLCEKAQRPAPPYGESELGLDLREAWNACADYIEREGGKDG